LYLLRDGEIVAVDLAALTEKPLGIQADDFRVSPDGTRIAFVLDGTLGLADAEGQNRRVLSEGANHDFSWAPDSRAIAFVKARKTALPTCPSEAEIWVHELGSEETRRIDAGCNPAWSPDSLRLAYVSAYDYVAHVRGEGSPNGLHLINRYGENRWTPYKAGSNEGMPAADVTRRYVYDPFWSVDGTHVFVKAFITPEWALARVDTIEMVDAYDGSTGTVAMMYGLERIVPSPNGDWIADQGIVGATGLPGVAVYELLGEEYLCDVGFGAGTQLALRTQRVANFWGATEATWSPDGQFLAVSYCPYHLAVRCYEEPGLADIRLIDWQAGSVSSPLLSGVDPYRRIEWRP
jgi:dipeptidyl aminopeptidase/acylaminoacyl peptidase